MDYREINRQPGDLNHVRYYFKQIDMLRQALNNEQMGRLFYAVADFAQTGVRTDVEGDILFPYHTMCNAVDKARNGGTR